MTDSSRIQYRAFFKSLLAALPLPIFVIDRDLRIHYYNEHAVRLTNEQSIARQASLDQVISQQSVLDLVRVGIQSAMPQQGQHTLSGSAIIWRVSVSPLQDREESQVPHYFAVAIEDMAEAHLQEHVQRDFIANISHELRTPLSSVRLLAETLEDIIDTDPDKAQEFVEKIEVEVQYLSDLVSELLELSRIESGQMPITIEPVQAEQLVREVMARMLPLSQRHRVRLKTEIHDGQMLVVADSKLIVRVLVNLVHNAVKFTPSGGMIVIGTALEPRQHLQRFFVHDTGIGIPAEDLPRVFERFYKTDRARTKMHFMGPDGGGTGLGLAIARHVVEAHGGRISAESEPEQGSTFIFTLPVAVTNA